MYPNKVRETIRQRGLNQKYMAEQLGISYRAMQYRLDGKYPFKPHERRKLARLLRSRIGELFPEGQS